MLTKEKLIKSFDTLPENLTIDQVIDRVIMLDKIEQGLKDVENGNVFTTEEVKVKLNKWYIDHPSQFQVALQQPRI
jgi:predicted transcriptional regulator